MSVNMIAASLRCSEFSAGSAQYYRERDRFAIVFGEASRQERRPWNRSLCWRGDSK